MNEREKAQLLQRIAKLEAMVQQLMQPKSVARVMTAPITSVIHFKSKLSAIAAFDAGTLTMGSSVCDEYTSSSAGVLTDSGDDITIYNAGPSFPASTHGIAIPNKKGLPVIVTAIRGLRLNGSDFQYTHDGTNWITWTTGTTCT